jgi:hypothetical protein
MIWPSVLTGALMCVLLVCAAGRGKAELDERGRVDPSGSWELTILDGMPPKVDTLAGLGAGDVDGDGWLEVITGGGGALLWYRPATCERGLVAEGRFGVGVAMDDLDGDGIVEMVVSEAGALAWYEPQKGDLGRPWVRHVIDPGQGPHDLLFADMDGDGRQELVGGPPLRIYRRPTDPTQPWPKSMVDGERFAEGTSVADLDGDGRAEIVFGPYVLFPPEGGPFAGPWRRTVFAPGFREMCRTAVVDITGNGRPDIVIVESEFMEGRLSWFENRLREDPAQPWVEHELDRGWVYGHSLEAWRDPRSREARFFIAEMSQGGWSPPRNWNARLMVFSTPDRGKSWRHDLLYKGAGTHQAVMRDVDGDGEAEVVGKTWGEASRDPVVQLWKRRSRPSPLTRFRHRLLERDKPYLATDILAADVDGDGLQDVVTGSWWYQNPSWERRAIPGVHQVVNAHDIDGDGRVELIATKLRAGAQPGYGGLTSDFCWLKPTDPAQGKWEEHAIGVGSGDWPHGTLVAPVLAGGRLAFIACYHSQEQAQPEIFEIPDDPRQPWPKRVLAEINYGEEVVAHDLTGDGRLDLVMGTHWLENLGDGRFEPHLIARATGEGDVGPSRIRVADINGDGRPEIVFVEMQLDYATRKVSYSRVGWFEMPDDPRTQEWSAHAIDRIRSPHSLDLADLDGDGELEIICGEHDPFWPYRTQSRLLIYKKADAKGRAWTRFLVDDRFEHHCGTKVMEVAPGRLGIISHGWTDSIYVHLWEQF